MEQFARRVVTGHDDEGHAVFVSDGAAPHTVTTSAGYGVSDLLWLNGPATTADDGEERAGAFDLEPPPGGLSVRIIRIPPAPDDAPEGERWIRVEGDDPARPGMHTTDTLDFIAVLDGEIVLGLDDAEHRLTPGDVVIQRATAHRWRVAGDTPCTYAAIMCRGMPGAADPVPMTPASAGAGTSWRRVVTGVGDSGRSVVVADGPPATVLRPGDGSTALAELWQTGGPLRAPSQGGDPEGGWELEPRNHGIAFRSIEMPAGLDSGDAGWHTTDTIDVDIVVSGQSRARAARRRARRARARRLGGAACDAPQVDTRRRRAGALGRVDGRAAALTRPSPFDSVLENPELSRAEPQ